MFFMILLVFSMVTVYGIDDMFSRKEGRKRGRKEERKEEREEDMEDGRREDGRREEKKKYDFFLVLGVLRSFELN